MITTVDVKKKSEDNLVKETKKHPKPTTTDAAPYKITTKDLDVYYGDFQALKSINMNISPYTVTALIGPSGCGKSTYLRVFNRMNDYIDTFRLTGEVWDNHTDEDISERMKKVPYIIEAYRLPESEATHILLMGFRNIQQKDRYLIKLQTEFSREIEIKHLKLKILLLMEK